MNEPSTVRRTQRHVKSPRNGLYAHRGQADWASLERPGALTPATPPPAGFFPPLLRRRLRRNESGSTQLKRRCSYGAGHRLLSLGRLADDLGKTIHLI